MDAKNPLSIIEEAKKLCAEAVKGPWKYEGVAVMTCPLQHIIEGPDGECIILVRSKNNYDATAVLAERKTKAIETAVRGECRFCSEFTNVPICRHVPNGRMHIESAPYCEYWQFNYKRFEDDDS